ncbi:MAG TPA: sugar kinase [Candidatus Corynebacterium avicola]|uniref:Sugar kinase n=1 Tax=Candidatus Corynebacterium avicola TaxID=2838527 RepID=A0A9D1RQZ4_9CORY|nr:sugar kinase [Candidatus Corynebacterium avicola]
MTPPDPTPDPAADLDWTVNRGARVVTFGETMAMLRSWQIGSLAHLPSLDISLAGAESNVAIGLQRLGVPTAWISKVGDDPLGIRVRREIRAEGVEIHCPADTGRPTGMMLKSRPTATTTRVDYYRDGSAASALSPGDLPADLIENAELLHLSGITPMLSASAAQALTAAVERAVAAGTRISLDVNYRSRLGSREHLAELLTPVVPHVDIIFGGPEELTILAPGVDGEDDSGILRAVKNLGPSDVVVKLGADGAATLRDEEPVNAPGLAVDVVDTVGAGDAFVAGYLSAWIDGADPTTSLERANFCGAFACTTPGDWEGAPFLGDLDTRRDGGDPVSR